MCFNEYILKTRLYSFVFSCPADSSIGDLSKWVTLRLMTFETFDQGDEDTWPDQQKYDDKDKYKDKDNDKDKYI